MITLISQPTNVVQQFRNNPWRYQQTFLTPLKDLSRFVSSFLALYSFEKAEISTDQVVFEPRNVIKLFESHSLHVENPYNFTVVANGQHDIAELLEAVLGNWMDFVFVPSPQHLAIYADHDEYTTFYTPTEDGLQLLTTTLKEAGFKAVVNYTRGAAEKRWR